MALIVDLEKRLGDFHLQASFRVEHEALALLGASGCGKSVTLKCIAGILRPDAGHIELDGTVLFDSAAKIDLPPQQRRVGYLFQNYALFPHMTVAQNVRAALRHCPRQERRQTAQQLMEIFHLTGLEGHYPAQLSGGQQQRVALVRILAAKPSAILLDEPFSALDACLKYQLELELEAILEDFGGSVLYVSHDRGEVQRHCRRLAVIDNGLVGRVTTLPSLLAHPATVAEARMAGCRNFTACTIHAGMLKAPAWGLNFPCSKADGTYTLGLPDGAVAPGDILQGQVERSMADDVTATTLLRLSTGETLLLSLPLTQCPSVGSTFSFTPRLEAMLLLPSP